MDTPGLNMTTNLMETQEATKVEEPSVQDPLSSGYASDLPLTSPEAGGATQIDWESSREGLDSATDSPLSPPQVTTKQFPQVRGIFSLFPSFFSLALFYSWKCRLHMWGLVQDQASRAYF